MAMSMSDSLLKNVKVTRVINAVSVGTGDTTNGSIIDMAGYTGVMFIVAFGAITDGTQTINVQQGAASDMSDAADLTGTAVSTTAITDDNKCLIVEVRRPEERYLRVQVDRAGATGCVIDGAIAIQYGARSRPTTQGSTIAASETHLAPVEGTA